MSDASRLHLTGERRLPAGLQVFDDAPALARAAADWLAHRIERSGVRFTLCLAGGSTPRPVYELLSAPRYRALPWDRVHWFWGDERFVPENSPDSNYGMAREALLSRLDVPSANIHPIPTRGVTPEQAAARYEAELMTQYGAESLDPVRPLFDVTLLGLGEDGHTASLLPGQPVLEETRRWVAAVVAGRPQARITLTYPALESSGTVLFLVSGASKRNILSEVLSRRSEAPAAHLQPQGELLWFADRAAAPGR